MSILTRLDSPSDLDSHLDSQKVSCFPAVNGKVSINLVYNNKPVSFTFPVREGVFIYDCCPDEDGSLLRPLKGCSFTSLVKGIFKNVLTRDMEERRMATLVFLSQINSAIEKADEEDSFLTTETIFGFKYIELPRRKIDKKPLRDFSRFFND